MRKVVSQLVVSCAVLAWVFMLLLSNRIEGQTVKYTFSVYQTGLSGPYAVAKSRTSDAVYMSEYNGNRVKKKSSKLSLTTIAGTGADSPYNGNVLAINARLNSPGVVLEYNNEVYITDYDNNRLRKINSDGVLIAIAGNGKRESTGDNGAPLLAALNGPWCTHITSSGDIYIAEYNGHRIRKIQASDGKIYTVAGTGDYGSSGDGGAATKAKLANPWGVFVNSADEIFIADTGNNRIRKVSGGIITTIAGSGGSTSDDIIATSASLNKPTSVFISPANELFIADADNGKIRKVNLSTMKIYTVISSLSYPTFAYVAENSDLYISEGSNGQIRLGTAGCDSGYQINSNGTICNPVCNSQIGRAGCSYHGSCNSPGVCTCDTGYTSSDCSQPICNGKTGSAGCSGFGSCTAPDTCVCNTGYSGSDCSAYYCGGILKSSTSVCSGTGTCTAPDTCSCQSNYVGSTCQYPTCNGIPSNNEKNVCNGGGSCVSPNTCSCFTNYSGSQCEITTCSGISNTNGGVCSGRGTCVKYNNCSCSANYYGSNCELTQCYGVISNLASTCSSHGKCDGYNKCTCDSNYFGLDCSVTSCYGLWSNTSTVCTSTSRGSCNSYNNCTCSSSYYGTQCQDYDCFGVNKSNSSVCSGKGTCSAPNTCVCTDSNFSGLNCNASVCYGISSTDASVCSGSRGSCSSPNNCSCYTNYFGSQCQYTKCGGIDNSNTTYVCSGTGNCTDFNKCVCKDGYYGPNCELTKCFDVLSNSSSVCSSHGTCSNINTCNCYSNYSGPNCNITTCYGISNTNSLVCSSHGSCTTYNTCSCSSTYTGQQCQDFSCYGVNKASPSVCSNHGTCTDVDTCSCSENWYGGNCNLTTCYGVWNYNSSVCSGNGVCSSMNNCTCASGYYGSNCDSFDCFGYSFTSNICQNNGSCTGPGICTCTSGYSGNQCQYPICYGTSGGSSSVCSGNGKCVDRNTCSCADGWFDSTCNVTICSGKRSDNLLVCNSQGLCAAPNKCTCNSAYTGSNCEFNVCYGKSQNDSSVCSGRGQCLKPGECTCSTGFKGSQCQYYQIDFDEKLATLKPTLTDVLKYSYLFNGTCENLFEKDDLSIIGENPICIWSSSKMIIYLGFGTQLQTGNVLRVKNSNLAFYVDISNSLSYSGTGFVLKKLMTNAPASSPIPIRPIVDNNFQSFTNFSSLVWSCISCSTSLNDYLKSQQREYLYVPSSYLKTLSVLALQLTASNFASNSTKATISFQLSQSAAPNLDLVTELDSNSQITCTGFDCIVETEPIGYGNNAGMFLGSFSSIKYGVYMSRFFYTTSGALSSGSTSGTILLLAKHTQSSTSYDYYVQYTYNAYDSSIPVVISALNSVYSPSSFIKFKATIFNPIVFVRTGQDTYYLWKLYKIDNSSGKLTELDRELYIDLYYSEVTVKKTLDPGNYLMYLKAVAAYGSTLVNTTFTVLNTTDSLASVSFSSVPTISPISEDLVITATINGTKSAVSWDKISGRIKPYCNLQISESQPSENITQSVLTITKSCLYEGEIYRFRVNANNSNGLSSSAEIQTQTDISPSIHCDFYSTSDDGSFIALDSSMLITCRKGPKDTIKSYTIEIHYEGERKFIVSNTVKKNLYFAMPYLIEGSQLVVRALNSYNTEMIYKKNLTSTLSSSDKVQLFINGYTAITTSETNTYFGIINSLNSLLSLFEYDQFDSLGNKASLQTTLKSMLSLVSNLRSTGVNVDDKLTALLLPPVYRIHKYLDSINGSRSSDDWRVDDLVSWTSYFVESILNTLQYYYNTQWKFLIDDQHLLELNELIQLGSSFNSEKFVLVQVQYKLLSDRMNGVTSTKSKMELSNGILEMDKLDSIDTLKSYNIDLYYSNTNVSIRFPSEVSNILAFGDETSDNSLNLFVKVSKSTASKIVGVLTSVNIQTQQFSELSVQNLTSTINVAFTGPDYPSSNVTCKYYNATSQQWLTDGVQTSISTSNNLVTITCLTNHLTTFAVFKNDILPNNGTSPVTQNDPTAAIVLGILLPLLAIIVIIIIVVIVVILVLRHRKKKLSSEVSKSSAIELGEENKKRGLFDTDISDFPSEESVYFKHLNSSSMASTLSSTSSSNDAFSRYKEMVKIGEGAFGSVFRVLDTKSNNKVKAIKVIRYKSVEELNAMMKEGSQLMNINHQYILKVNDFFVEKDNLLCIDMDFYPQGDLSSLINQQEDCKEIHIKQIIYQMCSALNFIHTDLKLIHRDVKPSNIFIKVLNGNVIHTVLADFGLAKDNKNSASMSFAGTPLYMSPELALGGKYYSNTDEYSLGVTVYQLMTKDNVTAISHLYMSRDAKEVQALCRKRLKESGDYSDRLIDICLQMLEKDNCSRPYAQDILENSYFNDIKKIR